MQIPHAHAVLAEEVGEFLGHLLGEGRHEDSLVALDADADLFEEVVDLSLGRLDDDLGVDEAGRTDDLLDDPVSDPHLVPPGSRRQIDGLPDAVLELIEAQRAVVER